MKLNKVAMSISFHSPWLELSPIGLNMNGGLERLSVSRFTDSPYEYIGL